PRSIPTERAIPSAPAAAPPPPTGAWSQASPSHTAPVPSTLPSPGQAPAAPAVPVAAPVMTGSPVGAPPRSGALVIALVVVGVLAVGLLVAVVVLLGGGHRDAGPAASSSSGAKAAGCVPNATCVPADVPDPAHADAQAILPGITKIAKSTDSR